MGSLEWHGHQSVCIICPLSSTFLSSRSKFLAILSLFISPKSQDKMVLPWSWAEWIPNMLQAHSNTILWKCITIGHFRWRMLSSMEPATRLALTSSVLLIQEHLSLSVPLMLLKRWQQDSVLENKNRLTAMLCLIFLTWNSNLDQITMCSNPKTIFWKLMKEPKLFALLELWVWIFPQLLEKPSLSETVSSKPIIPISTLEDRGSALQLLLDRIYPKSSNG